MLIIQLEIIQNEEIVRKSLLTNQHPIHEIRLKREIYNLTLETHDVNNIHLRFRAMEKKKDFSFPVKAINLVNIDVSHKIICVVPINL